MSQSPCGGGCQDILGPILLLVNTRTTNSDRIRLQHVHVPSRESRDVLLEKHTCSAVGRTCSGMQGRKHGVQTHRNMHASRKHSGVLIHLNGWLQGRFYTALKIALSFFYTEIWHEYKAESKSQGITHLTALTEVRN